MTAAVLDEGSVHCLKCGRLARWLTIGVDYMVVIDINCLWCKTYRMPVDDSERSAAPEGQAGWFRSWFGLPAALSVSIRLVSNAVHLVR